MRSPMIVQVTATRCLLAILIPTAAHASFNAAPCGTIDCHSQMMGILRGVIGGYVGLVVFEIAARGRLIRHAGHETALSQTAELEFGSRTSPGWGWSDA